MISGIRFVAPLLFLLLAPGCAVVERAPSPSEPGAAQPVPPPAGAGGSKEAAPQVEITAIPPPARVPSEPLPRKPDVAPAAAKPAAPPAPALDLAALETRLKETKAIGVFTKITLKNQVDDLLEKFRAFYQGRVKTSLGELRQPYESLILKVLALLQDGDPELARAIVTSREAIWGILADPAKFATL